jgi:alcohol dehydrogenase
MYAHAAFARLVPAFPRVLADASDLEARGCMLLGAALAGLAIENSMLGAAHACANPLTAHFGVVHGEAVGLMVPHVIRFNAALDHATRLAYAELASAPEIACVSEGLEPAVEALIERVEALLEAAGIARSLAELGVEPSAVPTLAAEAHAQWTARFNPRPLSPDDFANLYASAFEARVARAALPAPAC